MKSRRHPRYWILRFILAFGIVSLPATLLWLDAMQPGWMGPLVIASPVDGSGVLMAVAAGLWFAGVIWMIRIIRGPIDRTPRWRYRDR